MEKAFWVAGPVPPAHLDALALPRPEALDPAVAAINDAGWAWIGGPSGCGQTTLLHQLARALGRPLVAIDLRCLPAGTAAEALAHVQQDRPRAGSPPAATWDAAVAAWHPEAVVAFDGFDPGQHGWVRQVAAELDRPVVAAGAGGPIVPGPLREPVAQGFLERRSRRVRVKWTGSPLREAVGLARGQPAALQALGAAALHGCLERGGRRVLLEDVLDAAVEVAQRGTTGGASWRRLEGPRRSLLLAMARDPDGTVTAWSRRCGLEPKAAVVHLGRLVQSGLAERQARGRYAIQPLLRLSLQPSGGAVVRLVHPTGPFAAR
ncbi:MAG: hypothetical protein ACYC2H_04980 [Thermoplasmatota archaeon]